jgi:ATP-binding protein involved in chromosome partitioning
MSKLSLREHADEGVPLVLANPDDPAARAIHQIARGLIALVPLEHAPAGPLAPANGAPEPLPASESAAERKPAGMSLPMA